MRDASRGIYKRVIVKQDRVVVAVLYGDTQDGNWYFDLLKRQEDVSQVRDALIFGQAFAAGGGASANPNAAVAALAEEIGRAHVRTPVTNVHILYRLALETQNVHN